jgi:WD40 repeat protein
VISWPLFNLISPLLFEFGHASLLTILQFSHTLNSKPEGLATMPEVFISYSRKDKVTAARLTEALQKSELETWIDWEDIPPTADWMDQIHKGIERADAFIFLLSPDSVKSEVCGKEIDHAVQNGKRLIPIVVRDVSPNDVHPALAKANWIFCREQDHFDEAVTKTISAIHTDLTWVEAHRRLQVRAIEWDKRKDRSLLLRGKDLREAEEQLASVGEKDPQPTDLQRQYTLASRNGETRTRNLVLAIGAVIMVALALLSVFAFNQQALATTRQYAAQTSEVKAINESNARATAQSNAETQARIARSRELAANSIAARPKSFDLSLLLGNEAFLTDDNSQTRGTLLENALLNPHLIQFLSGHRSSVTSIAFSPDKKIIAAGSDDGTVILWDAMTYLQIGSPLAGHNGWITSIAFSPDGKFLASGSCTEYSQSVTECPAGQIILWDVTSKNSIGSPIVSNAGAITSLAFGPGNVLAAGDYFGGITLWDMANLQPLRERLTGHTDEVTSLAFSSDGQTLASGSFDNTIYFWNTSTYTHAEILSAHTGITGYNPYNIILAFSPDGNILASGSADRTIILWNATTHSRIGEPLLGHTGNINSVSFSADGNTLASGSSDGTVILWDVASPFSPYKVNTLIGQGGGIYSLAFGPENILASGSDNGTVALWDPAVFDGRLSKKLSDNGIFALSPDGKTLATGGCASFDSQSQCNEGSISFSALTGNATTGDTLLTGAGTITALAFGPDGAVLASGNADGKIVFWNPGTLQRTGDPLIGQTEPVMRLTFSPDGKTLAAFGNYSPVIWDLEKHQQLDIPPLGATAIPAIAFSQNSKTLAIGTIDSNIIFWDLQNRKIDHTSSTGHDGGVQALAYSPDGQYLAVGNGDGTIVLWNASTLQPSGTPLETEGIVTFAFSPDSLTLAVGEGKGITLWNVASHQQISERLDAGSLTVSDLAFTPDGKALVSGGWEIRLWNFDPTFWMEKTCQRAGRNFTPKEWHQYFPDTPYPSSQEKAICPQWSLEPEETAMPTITPTSTP